MLTFGIVVCSCTWFHLVFVYYPAGLKGSKDGLFIDPQLPKDWDSLRVTREFRGSTYEVSYYRDASAQGTSVLLDGDLIHGHVVPLQEIGSTHQVSVVIG